MRVHNASRKVRNATVMAADLVSGAYPRFVYGGALRGVPVFTTHGVTPELFESQLQFLQRNGYRTLTADEWYDAVTGKRPAPAKSVMLTYDDGVGSLWSVGLPLLKRYGMKIVVFLIPGRIRSGGLGPTLDDVKAGRADAKSVTARDAGDRPFLTWEEISAMHATGLVDFQSHTMTHSQVFCSPQVEAFLDPTLAAKLTRFQIPEWTPDDDGKLKLGRPLYAAAPRMSDCRRYFEDAELRRGCEAFVAQRGGAKFFERPDWREALTGWYEQQRRAAVEGGRYETDEERRAALWHELYTSKAVIEQHLPGKVVRHLAYPWGVDSELAAAVSADAGYVSNFPGKVAGSYMGVKSGRPLVAARFGMDFLFTLPGAQRRSLWSTLTTKLERNVNGTTAKRVRVLFVNRNCLPSVGGIQVFLDSLGRRLADRGTEVVIAATQMPRSTDTPGDLPYRVVYSPGLLDAWRLVRRAQIVHLNDFNYAWWALAKLLGKRVVLMYHSPARICPKGLAWNGREQCGFDTHWRQCLGCLHKDRSWAASCAKWLSFPVKQWLARTMDAVVNASQYAERRFRIPGSRTIQHGMSLGQFSPADKPSQDYFLYIGRLVPEKGCDVLLKALGKCASKGRRIRLVIVGDGPKRGELDTLAKKLGIADLVEFQGPLRGRALVNRMQHALALVMPSVWPELYGFVAVEAMACGTPVIASASGGLVDTAGEAGLTVPPGDPCALAKQMLRVADDPTLQRMMREAGLMFAARHETTEQMSEKYLALYRGLVS